MFFSLSWLLLLSLLLSIILADLNEGIKGMPLRELCSNAQGT
jgi:hypothetical protein